MIAGIGVDMIEIQRVIHACERENFLAKIFSEREIAQMDKNRRRAASDFAGKEAVVKALGTGFAGVEACEIEILRGENGAPYIELHGGAARKAEELGICDWKISITNTKDMVTAFVVASTVDGM